MDDPVSIGFAGLGALLLLIGLWAVLRLLRPAHAEEAPAISSRPADPTHTGSLSSASGSRERVACLVARFDKVIQSPIAGVYINLGKCFEDLGFQLQRAGNLTELEFQLREGVPAVMCVDCRLGPRTLREVARLANRFPGLRECVFLFYNADRPETLAPPAVLPHAHFLGLAFASQQVMEVLAPAFEFEEVEDVEDRVDAAGQKAGTASRVEKETGAVFEGKVSENSLPEILQFLEVGRRTGLLSLETEHPAGVINFQEGDIVSAQTHTQEGVEAVYEILSLSRGKFRFFPGRVLGRSGMRLSATEVLLHWAQRQDETGEMVTRQAGDSLFDTLS